MKPASIALWMIAMLMMPPATAQTGRSAANVDELTYAFSSGGVGGAAAACMTPPCIRYAVTVQANGTVEFNGWMGTTAVGLRRFRISPQIWRTLIERLAPYRPNGRAIMDTTSPDCGEQAPEIIVSRSPPFRGLFWSRSGRTDELAANLECTSPEGRQAAARVEEARRVLFDLLPLAALVDGGQ